jgi:hypothetical protein
MGPYPRIPSGPAVMYDCINRPDTRLHPTKTQKTSSQPLQCGSHPHRTFTTGRGNDRDSPDSDLPVESRNGENPRLYCTPWSMAAAA